MIEQERRLSYGNIVSVAASPVTLDTKGTYATASDDFLGNVVITVTVLDAFRKQVMVEINWQEQVNRTKVIMKEYYSTNIVNDTLIN